MDEISFIHTPKSSLSFFVELNKFLEKFSRFFVSRIVD